MEKFFKKLISLAGRL